VSPFLITKALAILSLDMQVPSLCELYVEMIKTILGESTLYGKRKNTESPLSAFERIFGVLFDQSMRDVIDANRDDDKWFIDTRYISLSPHFLAGENISV